MTFANVSLVTNKIFMRFFFLSKLKSFEFATGISTDLFLTLIPSGKCSNLMAYSYSIEVFALRHLDRNQKLKSAEKIRLKMNQNCFDLCKVALDSGTHDTKTEQAEEVQIFNDQLSAKSLHQRGRRL